ncbi:DUF58 domain-containing protein [Ornithinicoccus hortensis]|uniref:Uncharacterized protein (DUF58 family) n=1 Tax=Ornithinicoccus hortensis TaxID=82346 RepID=A0A542YUC6_9MICO|nr:DUF58 domain-containing protein [Ornithinicoccus hortensis]TQL51681.1 uncharacterized protein (DUF58 family) [Ornithinicoccus hortensis]
MSRHPRSDRWSVTHAHVRALFVAGLGAAAAVLGQRSDLLILVTPVLGVLVWSSLTRPGRTPARRTLLLRDSVREGDRDGLAIQVSPVPDLDLIATSVAESPFLTQRPAHGARVHLVDEEDRERGVVQVVTGVDPQRWGRRRVGPSLVGGLSPWGAFRWGPVTLEERTVLVLPTPEVFDTSAPAPHPRGLVGQHQSRRPGEGSEFASIRPFQWGDRLRRIHWPRSLRTGQLHVTSTFADQDTHVALIVDAHYDLGQSGGVHGAASTLDHSVRSAASIAEHFLRQGDRVSLQVLSERTPVRLPAGTGLRHYRRLLSHLALVQPAPQDEQAMQRHRTRMGEGTLVVMISALVSPTALTQAAALSRSGVDVLVIDALVEGVEPPGEDDALAELAWRIRLLEREREVRQIQQAGVPVVPWRGPGSLDQVLRALGSRGRRSA